eukprot:PLAT10647.2.p1 GENE.PLAT10647.2~~PLAT10647.2.p1  ORF type:complete len:485 (-),score=191.11 PLAT10647.2:91-1545(-)
MAAEREPDASLSVATLELVLDPHDSGDLAQLQREVDTLNSVTRMEKSLLGYVGYCLDGKLIQLHFHSSATGFQTYLDNPEWDEELPRLLELAAPTARVCTPLDAAAHRSVNPEVDDIGAQLMHVPSGRDLHASSAPSAGRVYVRSQLVDVDPAQWDALKFTLAQSVKAACYMPGVLHYRWAMDDDSHSAIAHIVFEDTEALQLYTTHEHMQEALASVAELADAVVTIVSSRTEAELKAAVPELSKWAANYALMNANSFFRSADDPWELLYWPGFAGRGEFVRVMFEELEIPYVDIGVREGVHMITPLRKSGPPPLIRRGSVSIRQTFAIVKFLAGLKGAKPDALEDEAAADELTLDVLDALMEAMVAYHPVSMRMPAREQVEEAKVPVADFLAGRLPRYLCSWEAALASVEDDEPRHVAGGRLTYADLVLFNFMRGMLAQKPEVCPADKFPLLHAHYAMMSARPRLAAFVASERSQDITGDSFC